MRNGEIHFSSGWFVTVELLRNTALTADTIAPMVHLGTAAFIDELARWSEGQGLPYGITVDREAQTFAPVQVGR